MVTDPSELYDRAAKVYGTTGPSIFDTLGRRLVELVAVDGGSCVLDVGCGRGAALRPAAERATHGAAVGLDVSFEMVRQTSGALLPLVRPTTSLVQGDARALPTKDDAVDRITCAFTLFWFDAPEQSFSEMRRTLRPGGTAGLSMTSGGDARWAWYGDLLMRYHDRHGVLAKQPPGNGLNQDPGAVVDALTSAGFEVAQVVLEAHDFVFPTVDAWWAFQWSHGARLPLEAMSPAVREQFRHDCEMHLEQLKTRYGYPQTWPMSFILAA